MKIFLLLLLLSSNLFAKEKYDVICYSFSSHDADYFERKKWFTEMVEEKLENGWRLQGGISTTQVGHSVYWTQFCQAFSKTEKKK